MNDVIKNPSNHVDRTSDGRFHAFWHSQLVVTKDGRMRQFEVEADAWEFLAVCDNAGRIIQ